MTMIDLRSDTLTKPTAAMRQAMFDAEVGDDCYGEDPTVSALEKLAAEMSGKEAGLFVTSGTQGNQIAVMVHATRCCEVICEASAHIFGSETGGIAALTGAQAFPLPAPYGKLTPELIEPAIRRGKTNMPTTALIALENTHNSAGGVYYTPDELAAIHRLAQAHGVPVHIDGARIFNAAVAQQLPLEALARHADSLQICLSKGLCAPVGSLLVGGADFIAQARRYRRLLGGGMRQAGVIAAAGIVALTTMVERLADDHAHARLLAEGAAATRIGVDLASVQTNIVQLDVSLLGEPVEVFLGRLKADGVLASAHGHGRVRMVTHRDVSREQIERTVAILGKLAG